MKTVRSLRLRGERALVRVDFNVPLEEDGSIADDRRIRAALPTIRHVITHGAACVLMTHLGRPGGKPVERLRLDRVAERASELLDLEVQRCDDIAGKRARYLSAALEEGQILLLQNLRFDPGETTNDSAFAARLAALGSVYINEAFASSHRIHASMYALPRLFSPDRRAAGLLLAREIEMLDQVLDRPERPFVAVLGGTKVEGKLGLIRALLDRVDRFLIGGALTYTFMRARGQAVGASPVATAQVKAAAELLELSGERLVLPVDHVVAPDRRHPDQQSVVAGDIPGDLRGLDIGPETAERYRAMIVGAGTALWHGPVGRYEHPGFGDGTRRIAEALADCDGTRLVGGGETGQAVSDLGMVHEMTHVSTGGDAFAQYLQTQNLPALIVLGREPR